MRKATFIGGPCDGKAMILWQDKHPYILMPVIDHQPTALFDAEDLDPTALAYKIARYQWLPFEAGMETVCDFYVFAGMQ